MEMKAQTQATDNTTMLIVGGVAIAAAGVGTGYLIFGKTKTEKTILAPSKLFFKDSKATKEQKAAVAAELATAQTDFIKAKAQLATVKAAV
jgi:hypothetical protein